MASRLILTCAYHRSKGEVLIASIHEQAITESAQLNTINVKGSGHPLDPFNVGQIIKPGELVDFVEITPLNRTELIMYNQLLAHAWSDIGERGKVHRISKAVLRGSHESNDRLNKAFDRLMGAWARIQYKHPKTGKEKTLRVHLIGSNAEEQEQQGYFYWFFTDFGQESPEVYFLCRISGLNSRSQ